LSAPAQRALASAGIDRLEQFTEMSEDEIKHLHGIGRNALGQLRQALEVRWLSFREAKVDQSQSMGKVIRAYLDNIRSEDGVLQNKACSELMKRTEAPASWARGLGRITRRL
jgi:hypothetical protein